MPDSTELQSAYGLTHLDDKLNELNDKVISKVSENSQLFDELAAEIHPVNVEKGFWGDPEFMDKVAGKLALVHSEVTEVLEALRKSQGAGKVTEEFADIFIRCLDLHAVLVERKLATPGLTDSIRVKMEANKSRPPKHGHVWG